MKSKIIISALSFLACLFEAFCFNPFFPIWGRPYKVVYADGNAFTALPSKLNSFLQSNHFSDFEHFSAIAGLACLYTIVALFLLSLVLSIFRRDTTFVLDSIIIAIAVSTCLFLMVACDASAPFTAFHCLVPFIAGLACLLTDIVRVVLKRKQA